MRTMGRGRGEGVYKLVKEGRKYEEGEKPSLWLFSRVRNLFNRSRRSGQTRRCPRRVSAAIVQAGRGVIHQDFSWKSAVAVHREQRDSSTRETFILREINRCRTYWNTAYTHVRGDVAIFKITLNFVTLYE